MISTVYLLTALIYIVYNLTGGKVSTLEYLSVREPYSVIKNETTTRYDTYKMNKNNYILL